MANHLKPSKQEAVIQGLVEGCSVRSLERMTGVHRDTILRLMVRVGDGCNRLLDESLRNLDCRQIQIDELWTFVGKKQRRLTPKDDRREKGDFWTFIALDADTKLIPAHRVGKRNSATASAFLKDLASRLSSRVQISSDSLPAYIEAIWWAFDGDVDYAQVVKSYESEIIGPGRYSPPIVTSVAKSPILGSPNMDETSTSYVERVNLSLRTSLRRFTRLSLGFSRKVENLRAAVNLYVAYYNFVRVHRTLQTTPAVAAGVTGHLWSLEELLEATKGH
ncbi:MAG: IS1 family transposase [Armatimonadetes bacterium]|nr:IS1 family transposase [Armatimonadota bacterium]